MSVFNNAPTVKAALSSSPEWFRSWADMTMTKESEKLAETLDRIFLDATENCPAFNLQSFRQELLQSAMQRISGHLAERDIKLANGVLPVPRTEIRRQRDNRYSVHFMTSADASRYVVDTYNSKTDAMRRARHSPEPGVVWPIFDRSIS